MPSNNKTMRKYLSLLLILPFLGIIFVGFWAFMGGLLVGDIEAFFFLPDWSDVFYFFSYAWPVVVAVILAMVAILIYPTSITPNK